MKVKDLLNYLINYGEEGFSLEDNVKVRMFMHHGKAGKRGDRGITCVSLPPRRQG